MRKVTAAILTWLALATAAPSIARTPAEIVLTGTRNASAELTLHRAVRLECCDYYSGIVDGRMTFRVTGLDVETAGSYAGFVIERAQDGRVMKGALRVPAMDLDEGRLPMFVEWGRANRLPPGEYRIHLLTDGRSVVRVAAPGLAGDVRLSPKAPSDVSGQLVTLATAAGPRSVQERVALDVSRGATVVLASKTEGELAQAHLLAHCVTAPGGQCSAEHDYEPWVSPASGGGGGTKIDVLRGTLPPGTHEAVFTAGSAGAPRGTYGFVLVLG